MNFRYEQDEDQAPAPEFDRLATGPIEPFDPALDVLSLADGAESKIFQTFAIAIKSGLAKSRRGQPFEEQFTESSIGKFSESDAATLQRTLFDRRGSGIDLALADLRRRDLASLEEELRRCNLRMADLTGARLIESDLEYSDLRYASLAGVMAVGADFLGADMRNADCRRGNFTRALFGGTILAEANFEDATLVGSFLFGANLRGANLVRANLTGANLAGADLTGADLYQACLYEANLAGAVMPNGKRYVDPHDDDSAHIVAIYSV